MLSNKTSEKLISVIVPVYNVEKYLDRCIESIVNQTYKNLEIILVDDGSLDNSPAMCDEWAKKDSRIKVIHKENRGAGAARNTGIEEATGKFLGFIDSDDYIDAHFYEHLVSLVSEDIDIAECNYTVTESDKFSFCFDDNYNVEKVSAEKAMELNIKDTKFKQVIWNKLYRKDVLKNVFFPEGYLIDDEFFTYKAIGNSRNLVCSSLILYAYFQNSDSVMHEDFDLRRLQAVEAQNEKQKYIEQKFPFLSVENKIRIWGLSIYCGQMMLKCGKKSDLKKAMRYLKKAQTDNSLSVTDIVKVNGNIKYFFLISKISFNLVCKIRNMLNIGI